MIQEWFKLMQWQGPIRGTAMTALEAWTKLSGGPEPTLTTLFPAQVADDGDLEVRNGVPIMHLYGGPSELGHRHGWLQAGNVRALKQLYLDRVFATPQARDEALDVSYRMMEHAPPEYAAEIDALGRASGIGPADALLMQTFLDVMRVVACSTLALEAEASADGVPMIGRTLDFPGFGVAHRYNMVTVFHPTGLGRRSFASFTWPGLIGPLTGMNSEGLTLATMQVISPWQRLDAMPYLLLYRELLSRCGDLDEAEDMLRSARIGSTNNLMLMDGRGRVSVAELNPEGVRFRRPRHGGLVSTNHFRSAPHRMTVRCGRFASLTRRFQRDRGRFTAQRMKTALHHVAQGWLTLQAMILRPTECSVEFAFGPPPATEREYVRVELAPHFARTAAGDARFSLSVIGAA